MKHKKLSRDQTQKPASASGTTAAADLNQSRFDFTPAMDPVAKRACFSYVNPVLLFPHDEPHWAEAEALLLAEFPLAPVRVLRKRIKVNFPGD